MTYQNGVKILSFDCFHSFISGCSSLHPLPVTELHLQRLPGSCSRSCSAQGNRLSRCMRILWQTFLLFLLFGCVLCIIICFLCLLADSRGGDDHHRLPGSVPALRLWARPPPHLPVLHPDAPARQRAHPGHAGQPGQHTVPGRARSVVEVFDAL